MRLYYAPRTISIAAVIAFEEAGLSYDPIRVDFKSGEQSKPAYLVVNPKGRVPALQTETGTKLTETGAILEYIAALAPGAELVPNDPIKAAQMRSVMYYLAATMHVNHAHKMRGHRWADQQSSFDDMTGKVAQTMTQSAQFFVDECLGGDYVLGDTFSLADPHAYMICTWLEGDGVDLNAFPEIQAFIARMNTRASVKSAIAQGML